MKNIFLFVVLTIFSIGGLIGCSSLPPEKTTSQQVILSSSQSDRTKSAAAFREATLHLFRRYSPRVVDNTTITAKYGKYPITVQYRDNAIYMTSPVPKRHPRWLAYISKRMKKSAHY